ncbi:putative potassium channel protein YugO [Lentibacillus sp. JNUCC-1]|uniref:potassium channel family protein n=1 Tax=Lentibacillus sp. JNUCC-1 TaxID=2654513 RepID=UPI0012E966C3|nr:potassium channel family protein [Lentibacillus sp. JNUCC-1]MUV39238.1 putative potassium channel protein YugO [Lentibacillus sp. JNUCC-1]
MNVSLLKHIYVSIPKLIRLLIGITLIMTLFGTAVHLIEPKQFPTIFDGVWWAFVTGATVGYGDYVPLSTPGRLIGIMIILTGGGMLAYYITTLSAVAVDRKFKERHGELAYNGVDHFIFIGWNERTRQLIEMVYQKDPSKAVIVIDQTLKTKPETHSFIHYIHGNPALDLTLEKAGVYSAERVLITANTSQSEDQADRMTILTALAVRGHHQKVPVVTEILTDKHINNAKRAGATTIIRPNDFLSTLLYHELMHTPHATPFENILQLLNNQQFKQVSYDQIESYKTFQEASAALLEQHQILLGVIREDKWIINPGPNYTFKNTDTLLMFASWTNKKAPE